MASAQVNAKDAAGATPLHLAASPAAVEILLAVGASPQDTNNAGLQQAASCRPQSGAKRVSVRLLH